MVFHTGVHHVVRTDDVGLNGLHGEKLAGGHLLERGRVEHIIHPAKRRCDRAVVAHVADVEFDFACARRAGGLVGMAHVILFFFISGQDANFADIRGQKPVEHGVAE